MAMLVITRWYSNGISWDFSWSFHGCLMEVEVKEKLDHDLVLKPMVTWGSPILGPPKEARIINLSTYPYLSVCLSTSFSVCFSTSTFFYIFVFIHVVFSMFIRCLSLSVIQYASLLYLISGFSDIIYSLYAIPSSTFLSYHILSIYLPSGILHSCDSHGPVTYPFSSTIHPSQSC